MGEKREAEEEAGEGSGGTSKKIKQVAEMVLVLAGMGQMRGGNPPSEVEINLMAEARSKLTEVCASFAPNEIFPTDKFGSLIEDLGLNKLNERNKLGFRPPQTSIAEKFELSKRKFEDKSKNIASRSTPYQVPVRPVVSSSSSSFGHGVRDSFANLPSFDRLGKSNSLTHTSQAQAQASSSKMGPGVNPPRPVQQARYQSPLGPTQAVTTHPPLGPTQAVTTHPPLGPTQAAISQSMRPTQAALSQPMGPIQAAISFPPMGPTQAAKSLPPMRSTQAALSQPMGPMQAALSQPTGPMQAAISRPVGPTQQARSNPIGPTQQAISRPMGPTQQARSNPMGPTQQARPNPTGSTRQAKAQPKGPTNHTSRRTTHHAIRKLVVRILKRLRKKHKKWVPPSRNYMRRPLNCQICSIKSTETNTIIVCDNCERGFHVNCAKINQQITPQMEWEWYCNRCLSLNPGKKPQGLGYGRVTESVGPTKSQFSFKWVGDVVTFADQKIYYESCQINGVSYKSRDHVLVRFREGKVIPCKIQAMFEDNVNKKKWIFINKCYFPGDLPDTVCRPGGVEKDEVYGSVCGMTVMPYNIIGPCDVLPPNEFAIEKARRAGLLTGTELLRPCFKINWIYDELKNVFRDVTC